MDTINHPDKDLVAGQLILGCFAPIDISRNRLTVLSFGGGQDSTTLLYLYAFDPQFRARYAPGEFVVVMSDTGDEHPHTYLHIVRIRRFCLEHGIEFHFLTPDLGFHSKSWHSLRGFYRAKHAIGSKAYPKTCTDRLKLEPIYRWLEARINKTLGIARINKEALREYARRFGKIRMLIGIAAGEETRVAATDELPRWQRESIEKLYPLIDLGLDRAGCQRHIRSLGFEVPWPSNCILCPFMSEIELLWLYRRLPQDYAEWVELERDKLEHWAFKGEKNFGVWGQKTLPEKLLEAQTLYGHMSDAELDEYKFSHGHCVMSKY